MIGLACRAAASKRADLLFADLERLHRIARQAGPLHVGYGEKAHSREEAGKAVIQHV